MMGYSIRQTSGLATVIFQEGVHARLFAGLRCGTRVAQRELSPTPPAPPLCKAETRMQPRGRFFESGAVPRRGVSRELS